jgi:hypothetical protein
LTLLLRGIAIVAGKRFNANPQKSLHKPGYRFSPIVI